jgi:hypothetical protein
MKIESNQKGVKKIKVAPIVLICACVFGCGSPGPTHPIQFVDRGAVFSKSHAPRPLMLVVEMDEAGRLRLNKIETGTTADTAPLAEKLEAIFADRETSGIDEREVLIDSNTSVEAERYEELIRVLADAKASPIKVIRNDR